MQKNKSVIFWLLIGCLLIFIMVVVGGITRLTHSGLSISNYKLVSGTIPPMNEQEWIDTFDMSEYDFILDAIDDIPMKVELIKKYHKKLISTTGSAKRFDPTKIEYINIFKISVGIHLGRPKDIFRDFSKVDKDEIGGF